MAGYNGYSMSNNAVMAYSNGEKPLSKWTRSAILTAIVGMIMDGDLPEEIIADVDGAKTATLKEFLVPTSWHHTSSHYNRTTFYMLSDERILDHFGYKQVVCVTRADGTTVYGEYTGDRHPVTKRLQEFVTTDGIRFPSSEITSARIAYIKAKKGE